MAKPVQEAIDVKSFSSTEMNKIKREMQEYSKLKSKLQSIEKSLKYSQQQLLLNHKDKKCYNMGVEIDKLLGM